MRRPQLKPATVVITLLCSLAVLVYHHSTLEEWLNPEGLTESYNFQETSDEAQCFNSIGNLSPNPIPKVVHFLWGFGNHPEMTFMNYLGIRSALASLKSNMVKLHYEELNMGNFWFQKLRDDITLVHHDMAAEYPKQVQELWQVSHLTDALRLDTLYREGGIYLDTDVITLQSFDNLLHSTRDVVLGHEGGDRHCLCNAVILARASAAFLGQWIDTYSDFSPSEWNYHSVLLPKKMAANRPEEVCLLAPTAFFWPTWTHRDIKYMHAELSEEEVVEVNHLLETHGGAFSSNQLAYHSWSQVAREKHLDDLTPEVVIEKNTRFNMLVRRFI